MSAGLLPYIKVSGQWKYLYCAVDRSGDTVDFLLTAKRDSAATRRFLERAINLHDVPGKITIDKSGANTAAIESVKADACVDILMRQKQNLNSRLAAYCDRALCGGVAWPVCENQSALLDMSNTMIS